jgi:hypothetical protein
MKPPAKTARRIAFAISIVAVFFTFGAGYHARQAYHLRKEDPDALVGPVLWFLVLLLVALLLRMGAAVCELIWLERTWTNLPPELRHVGPMKQVDSFVLISVTLVPGIAWIWKLGVIDAVTKGFEAIRARVPFAEPVPRTLGMAAVIVSWIPGLNVYCAPFLWELFAIRIDRCVQGILERSNPVPKVGAAAGV